MAFLRRFSNLVKPWGGKHVRIGLSSSNSPPFQSTRCISSNRLYVGGLAYEIDERGLKEAFEPYGQLLDETRDSGRSRGFGFVIYTSANAADEAVMHMDGEELCSRMIKVSEARPHPKYSCDWIYDADIWP